jgi:hypothetical protein
MFMSHASTTVREDERVAEEHRTRERALIVPVSAIVVRIDTGA